MRQDRNVLESLYENEAFDRLLDEPLAIVFKHSSTCGISARAHGEVEKFLSEHPERRIHKVEVLGARAVSDYIEQRTGIRHESPQLLLLRDGEVVWHGSHADVTAEAIFEAVAVAVAVDFD